MSRACANCRRTLGDLETGYWWGEHTVCLPCYQALSQQQVAAAAAAAAATVPTADAAPAAEAYYEEQAAAEAYAGPGTCSSCGGTFEPDDLTTDARGQVVCMTCDMAAAAHRAKYKAAKGATRTHRAKPAPKSNATAWAVAATVGVLAAGGGAYYYLHGGGAAKAPVAAAVTPPAKAPVAAVATAGPTIAWESRVAQFTLEGNRLEAAGNYAKAVEQWQMAASQFPETGMTPEQAAQLDRLRNNLAKLEDRVQRGVAKASEKRGIFAFGGPFVAYHRSAPDPVTPKGPLFETPKVPAKDDKAAAAPKPKSDAPGADKTMAGGGEPGMDMMDKGGGKSGKSAAAADKSMDKSMDKGGDAMMDKAMDKGMEKGMEKGADEGMTKRDGDSSTSGGTAKRAKPPTSAPGSDEGQNLFGNVATKLGMNSRRGKAAVAGGVDVQLTDEQKALLLLDEGQAEEAAKAFEAILAKDPANATAHAALGCIALFTNRRAEGAKHFEKALATRPSDRVAAIDLAALTLDEDPVRSVRLLRAYLSAPNVPLDEQGLNALGTALTRAEHKPGDRAYLLESRDFFLRYEQRLNATRTDGKKHWGSEWVDANVADAKWAALLGPGYALEAAHQEWPKLTATRQKAWDLWQRATRNVVTAAEVANAKQNFEAASKAEQDLIARIKQYDAELDKAEVPKFSPTIELVLPQ